MAKAVLSLDDINLLKNSEEPKNTKLYGNLYESLCKLDKPKAVTLEQLNGLDNLAVAALTYNKKTLIDTVIKEWYAEKVSEEDPSKKVRCGLCNTPNKYLYYIRNRKNGILLNVGSHCITKFPGIEGYIEQKKQLNQIHKGHMVVARRNEFYNKFSDPEQFISDADEYFNTLPILLSYELYSKLQDTITRMRLIYTRYVNEGKKPFESQLSPFELFQLAINQYSALKIKADSFIKQNADKPLICRRREITWMISNNRQALLKQVSENNGLYTKRTLQQLDSLKFWKRKKDILAERNISELFKFEGFEEESIVFSFNKFGYQHPILFSAPLSSFVREIATDCIIKESYKYDSKEIKSISRIRHSKNNLESVLNYIYDMIYKLNCAFLFDDETGTLILYRKGDRSIRLFNSNKLLDSYEKYILLSDAKIQEYLFSMIKGNGTTKWVTPEMQAKQGIDDKIGKLYRNYKDSHSYANSQRTKHLEVVLYNTVVDPFTNLNTINFNSPEYISIPKDKILISNDKKQLINYGIRISGDWLYPFYRNGDILLVQDTQNVKDGDVLFYVSKDGLNTEKVYTDKEYEKISDYIKRKKSELKSYGKVIYCFRNSMV